MMTGTCHLKRVCLVPRDAANVVTSCEFTRSAAGGALTKSSGRALTRTVIAKPF